MNYNAAQRLDWRGPADMAPLLAEQRASNYRSLAMNIEDALKKDGHGVSLERPLAVMISRALWDLADYVER